MKSSLAIFARRGYLIGFFSEVSDGDKQLPGGAGQLEEP
jgi:hypothetical protein